MTWISGSHFARYWGELTCIWTAPDRSISTTSSILPSWPAGYSSTWICPLLLASTSFLKSAMVSAVVSPSPWELPNLILIVFPDWASASGIDRPTSATANTTPTTAAFLLIALLQVPVRLHGCSSAAAAQRAPSTRFGSHSVMAGIYVINNKATRSAVRNGHMARMKSIIVMSAILSIRYIVRP